MDFYTERYGKARPMTKEELKLHHEIIDKQNKEIENHKENKRCYQENIIKC